MASMVGYLDPEPVARMVKSPGMINKILQQICVAEGMNKAGVKAELQSRIIESRSIHLQALSF
jgi:E3 SUMO-protein ligase PIAS1